MTDRLTPSQRRRCMQANKANGTTIEQLMAAELWRRGLHYYKNDRKIIGKPDFTFRGYKVAVFCDGDFWHGLDWEKNKHRLENSGAFWIRKIERNIQRDATVNQKLHDKGWSVLRFWERDIKRDVATCGEEVENVLTQRRMEKAHRVYIYDTRYEDQYVASEIEEAYERLDKKEE